MKKTNQRKTTRTSIDTISIVGRELTDEGLRLVSGGKPAGGGTTERTKPASWTNPGEVDTATDTRSD